MFSLKPPRPTFRSYLLPPPQVNNALPASAPALGGSVEPPGRPRGAGEPREAAVVSRSPAARVPEPGRGETRLLGGPHRLGRNL